MGEAALLVTGGDRISERCISQANLLRQRLLERAVPGLRDVVPAYASLLVTFQPAEVSEEALRAAIVDGLEQVTSGENGPLPPKRHHVVPVRYGGEYGPDLESVAVAHSIEPSDVVKLHRERVYSVAFLGFLPGFAYMGRLPRRLESSRLASPRPRVAAGSVGLAGLQTGVYPFSSPGGWQIIGRTDLRVWDPARNEPALFAPGDTVRFAASDQTIGDARPAPEGIAPKHPAFEVIDAPGMATVQDLGREGLAHLGVGSGGVFDVPAARRANSLVGNREGSAVLEMTWTGPTMRALCNVTIALDGAEFSCLAGATAVPLRVSWFVRGGTVLRFAHAPRAAGLRGYMAVNGGLDVPLVLGSRSTSMLAHFGGMAGRALRAGDTLGILEPHPTPISLAGRNPHHRVDDISREDNILRFVPFQGRQSALSTALRLFTKQRWVLTEQADRMGCRFMSDQGEVLPVREGELVSFGVVRGAIQLPPGGMPVVLGVDHQTTGGYPLLGVVIEADLAILAQLRPGSRVQFVPVSVAEARSADRL